MTGFGALTTDNITRSLFLQKTPIISAYLLAPYFQEKMHLFQVHAILLSFFSYLHFDMEPVASHSRLNSCSDGSYIDPNFMSNRRDRH